MRILVAEDERNLNRILTEALTDEGYSVDPCFDGQEAWDALACAEYDVLVLDIMMPRMDGLTLVRKLRKSGSTTPVLFLTSRDSVEDKVEGLETGADYYLVKPFHMQELLAVVRVMARKYTDTRTNVYTIADLSVDVSAHTVVRAGRVIELTSREYALLEYMIRNKGVVLSRELPREEIAYICRNSPVRIEVFAHGALCMCYSGQCYMSAVIGPANR